MANPSKKPTLGSKRKAQQAGLDANPTPSKRARLSDSATKEAARHAEDRKQNKTGRFKNSDADWTPGELKSGDIIWAPWHVTALRSEQRKRDKYFTQTKCAIVCSKRRMFCVYYTHTGGPYTVGKGDCAPTGGALQAFPMFAHNHRGLKAVVSEEQRKLRIPVKNEGDSSWVEPSKWHPAVAVVAEKDACDVGKTTILDYTRSVPIELSEFIERVGRLTKEGTRYVLKEHAKFRDKAIEELQRL